MVPTNKRDELVERAELEYGISNASEMSDKQIEQEIKAIDEQAKSTDQGSTEDEGTSQPTQEELDKTAQDKTAKTAKTAKKAAKAAKAKAKADKEKDAK